MPTDVLLWIGGLVAMILLGLLGVVHTYQRKTSEKTDERVEKIEGKVGEHTVDLATLKPQVERNTDEIDGLRKRTHKLEVEEIFRRDRAKHPDG